MSEAFHGPLFRAAEASQSATVPSRLPRHLSAGTHLPLPPHKRSTCLEKIATKTHGSWQVRKDAREWLKTLPGGIEFMRNEDEPGYGEDEEPRKIF